MKVIPEEYHLDEEDIKTAISLYMRQRIGSSSSEYNVTFNVTQSTKNLPGACGGMADYYTENTITAVVTKKLNK